MTHKDCDSIQIVNGDYTDKNIKTLKDAAHIRQNPGMYVGNTQSAGLHHLVYELVYNSVDEALAGLLQATSASSSTSTARSPSPTTAAASPSASRPTPASPRSKRC